MIQLLKWWEKKWHLTPKRSVFRKGLMPFIEVGVVLGVSSCSRRTGLVNETDLLKSQSIPPILSLPALS